MITDFSVIRSFIKKNAVMFIAFFAAAVTTVFVPADREYLGYFDRKMLICLFCVLAVVCALKKIRFFYSMAYRIVRLCRNLRLCALALVYVTFIGSMLIANDMALLTFLPLGYFVLSVTGTERYMAHLFILQNIAANLGGMLTPFGNPQNLYLYSKFQIPTGEFVRIMLPSFVVSIVLFTLCCFLFFPSRALSLPQEQITLPRKRTALYLLLFALSVAVVFRGVPDYIGFAIVLGVLLIAQRDALKQVDYPLLLSFVFFFIFAGNMARIEPIRALLSGWMEYDPLLVSTLSCQVISNVPSAILLSQFTTRYAPLLVGVNIGGTGTLIASLASLITFREYLSRNPGKAGKYLLLFSAYNASFLGILLLLNWLIL